MLLVSTSLLLHLGLARHANNGVSYVLLLLQACCAFSLAKARAGPSRAKTGAGPSRPMAARLAPFACCLVLPACLLVPQPGMVAAVLVSHSILYGGLGLLFGRSLLPGREPLVTAIARHTEAALTAEMRVYTRHVTWLWAVYGPVQVVISLVLLASAPVAIWSAFVNVVDLPMLASVFCAEYLYRRWRLGGASTATLFGSLTAAGRHWRDAPVRAPDA